jgi:Arc/MetJ family transcription regulator
MGESAHTLVESPDSVFAAVADIKEKVFALLTKKTTVGIVHAVFVNGCLDRILKEHAARAVELALLAGKVEAYERRFTAEAAAVMAESFPTPAPRGRKDGGAPKVASYAAAASRAISSTCPPLLFWSTGRRGTHRRGQRSSSKRPLSLD